VFWDKLEISITYFMYNNASVYSTTSSKVKAVKLNFKMFQICNH